MLHQSKIILKCNEYHEMKVKNFQLQSMHKKCKKYKEFIEMGKKCGMQKLWMFWTHQNYWNTYVGIQSTSKYMKSTYKYTIMQTQ